MTTEEILSDIYTLLSQVAGKLDLVLDGLDRGWAWLSTPAGEIGILSRVTFGEMLLALLLTGYLGLKLIHVVYDVLAPRGWW